MYRYRKVFAVTDLWATGQETVFTQKQEIVRFKKQKQNSTKRDVVVVAVVSVFKM